LFIIILLNLLEQDAGDLIVAVIDEGSSQGSLKLRGVGSGKGDVRQGPFGVVRGPAQQFSQSGGAGDGGGDGELLKRLFGLCRSDVSESQSDIVSLRLEESDGVCFRDQQRRFNPEGLA